MIKRTFLKASAAACGLAFLPSLARAQKHAFGNPITVGLPLQAGSASDIAVRYVTNALSAQMGVSFVVENITGAGGIVGLDRLARAKSSLPSTHSASVSVSFSKRNVIFLKGSAADVMAVSATHNFGRTIGNSVTSSVPL